MFHKAYSVITCATCSHCRGIIPQSTYNVPVVIRQEQSDRPLSGLRIAVSEFLFQSACSSPSSTPPMEQVLVCMFPERLCGAMGASYD